MACDQFNIDTSLSDDEIYFGEMTLKEMKRHISDFTQRKTIGYVHTCIIIIPLIALGQLSCTFIALQSIQ